MNKALFSPNSFTVNAVFLFLAAFQGLCYWVVSLWQRPGEDLTQIAMYRHGDLAYFPIIRALSEWNFGEQTVLEQFGTGATSFPIFSSLLHGVFYGVFGTSGLIIADMIVAVLIFILLSRLLIAFKMPALPSKAIALLLVANIGNRLSNLLESLPEAVFPVATGAFFISLAVCLTLIIWRSSPLTDREPSILSDITLKIATLILLISLFFHFSMEFWWFRFPRPFVSDVFFFGAVLLMATSFRSGLTPIRAAVLGGLLAALIQSDIYLAFAVAFAIPVVLVVNKSISLKRADIPSALKLVLPFGIAAILTLIPFILQRLGENPSASARMGLFEIERPLAFFIPFNQPPFSPYLATLAIFVAVLSILSHGVKSNPIRQEPLITVPFLILGTLLSLPLVTFILGQGIQLYHFPDRILKTVALALVILVPLSILQLVRDRGIYQRVPPGAARIAKPLGMAALFVVIVLSIIFPVRSALFTSSRVAHMRTDFQEYAALENYRPSFVALTDRLELLQESGSIDVLGTLDHQVYAWWSTFGGGRVFLPDPFYTTLSDQQIEERLIAFCHLLGMSESEFSTFIRDPATLVLWLGHNKHQASKGHSLSSTDDYLPNIGNAIASTSIFESWSVALPESEAARLETLFRSPSSQSQFLKLPDTLVLLPQHFDRTSLPVNGYQLELESDVFQLWCRTDKKLGQ